MKKLSVFVAGLCFCVSLSACREVTPGLAEKVELEWSQENTAEICHYLYWPIPDPTASKELKLLHYQIMQDELDQRGVVCSELYPDVAKYRWKSMLEKTLD